MEDPWGSPWAADSPAKIELPAAPQNAHFSADSLFPRRNSRSPAPSRSPGFEDDDAWGGWNGGGAPDGSASGKESPGWGRSPGLKPLQMAPSVRSLSPDPWKEVALQRLDTTTLEKEERQPRARRASETSGDGRVVDSAISLGEGHELQREDTLKSGIPAVVPSLDVDATEDAWGIEVAPEAPAPDGIPVIQLKEPDSSPDVEIPVLDVKQEEHDKEPVEQLFTADEPVQKEDAIGIPNGVDTKEEQPIAAVPAIDDAAVDPEPEGDQLPPPIKIETATEPQHQPQESRDEIPESPAVSETKELESPSNTLQSQPAEQDTPWVLKDLGISYPVDLTKLDDLFPSTPAVTVEAELVPDVVIDDTFASSSERKAWYRISRFGSKRKHDLGDDDNYIRVGWSGSQIRDRTTQTVRRWMEEDSITGRVVLGRRLGGSGAVMFNWNSTAPAEIGEFLGRHSRNSSMTVRSAAPSPTASSFGWASSVPSSPAVARHPLANEFQNPDAREAQSPKEPKEPKVDSARHSLALEPPPLHTRGHIPTPIKIPPTLPIGQDEDGDDDWGDMMTATPVDSPSFTEDERGFNSNRSSIDPQSAFQFETVFDSSKVASPRIEKASKRPLSWHLGQTLAKPFKRGAKTPSTPLFPSPLSKPMTPPRVTPTRHTHTMSAGASSMQFSPARLSLSAEDEETVAKLLRDIPDLTYMLR
ncbi:uncharacterized protein TrAtP1_011376 [Trichoderma atroviride]|nr:hypothetical protein TrAtP1_011376 [Trichoderma atroviride]